MVTSGHDRAIRIYLRSNEPVILEEEREREMEEQMDMNMDIEGDRAIGLEEEGVEPSTADQATGTVRVNEVVLEKEGSDKVSSINSGSLRSADFLIATLERAEAQKKKEKEWKEECEYMRSLLTEEEYEQRSEHGTKPLIAPPDRDPFMMGMTPFEYVVSSISNISRMELESTLLVLPFENICQLVDYLTEMLQSSQHVEMCVRSLLFIFKLYEVCLYSFYLISCLATTRSLFSIAIHIASVEGVDEGQVI